MQRPPPDLQAKIEAELANLIAYEWDRIDPATTGLADLGFEQIAARIFDSYRDEHIEREHASTAMAAFAYAYVLDQVVKGRARRK
jgi:hypothetical protein